MKTRKHFDEDVIEIKDPELQLMKKAKKNFNIIGKRTSKKGKVQYKVQYQGESEDEEIWKNQDSMNGEDIQQIIEYEKILITQTKQTGKKSKKRNIMGCPKSLKKIKKNAKIKQSDQDEEEEAEEEEKDEQFIKGSDESSSIAVQTASEKEASIVSEEIQEPKIKKIIGKRIYKGMIQYLVKFENAWKNKEDLKAQKKMIKSFNDN